MWRNISRKIDWFLLASLLFFFALLRPIHLSGATKTLVLLPLTLYADPSKTYLRQGVKTIFLSRLSGGGLNVMGDEALEPLLAENEKAGINSRDRAEELARSLKADYAVFGSITSIGSGYSVDLSLLQLGEKGSKLKRVSKALDEDQFIPGLSEMVYQVRDLIEGKAVRAEKAEGAGAVRAEPRRAKGLFAKLGEEVERPVSVEEGLVFKPTTVYEGLEPTGRITLSMSVVALDMGDLDGDGDAELVVLSRKKLGMYKRRETALVLKDTFQAGIGEDFLKVSVGDGDGNGAPEIYLVSRYGATARSTVLEWKGKFGKLYRKGGHLQVIRDPRGRRDKVLFQGSNVGSFFDGKIHASQWKGKKLATGERLPAPKGIQFYTLAFLDLNGDGNPEWLGLGELDLSEYAKLYVWDGKGRVLWNGAERVGGTNNVIRGAGKGGGGYPGSPAPRIPFNSRPVIMDINGDGKREVLTIKNIPMLGGLKDFKIFDRASLTAYKTEGTKLIPAWRTPEIKYCVTDMQARNGTLYLAAQKAKLSDITKGSSRIMWFE